MVVLVNNGVNRAASGQLPLHLLFFQLFCYQNLEDPCERLWMFWDFFFFVCAPSYIHYLGPGKNLFINICVIS